MPWESRWEMGKREQGLVLFSGILWLVGLVVIVQLWLVTAALEALLAGHRSVLFPAAVASVLLFLLNGGLLMFVWRWDARIRRSAGPPE
jgi:hypothetical protein